VVFNFFKKKRDEEAHERIDIVHKILKESFFNVKRDMANLGEWQKTIHNSHKNNSTNMSNFEKRLNRLERELQSLIEKKPITKSIEIKQQFEEATLIDSELLNETINTLTSTHKKIFMTLFQLQKQLGTNKVSYKSLASVLYTNKSYAEIRSTLSQYISFLEDQGLVEKARKGKESFVGITDPGFDLIESLKDSNLEIKNKKI